MADLNSLRESVTFCISDQPVNCPGSFVRLTVCSFSEMDIPFSMNQVAWWTDDTGKERPVIYRGAEQECEFLVPPTEQLLSGVTRRRQSLCFRASGMMHIFNRESNHLQPFLIYDDDSADYHNRGRLCRYFYF